MLFRSILTDARGRGKSDQELHRLITQAVTQSPILEQGNADWLKDPRIKNGLMMNAYIFGDEKRLYGGVLAMAHPMRAAHRAYNFPSRPNLSQYDVVRAFVGLMHDSIEDAFLGDERSRVTDIEVGTQIRQCWGVEQKDVDDISHDVAILTDDPGADRLQIGRAHV